MKFISADFIDKSLEVANELNDETLIPFIEEFTTAQPEMAAYLLSAIEDDISEDENEILFLNGMIIWYATVLADVDMPRISMEAIMKADEDNEDALDALAGDGEDDVVFDLNEIIEKHPQRELLDFAASVATEDEDIEQESEIIIFSFLKVIIDAMHQAVE